MLAKHVLCVVHACPQEKVIWVDASAVVAVVADEHPAWDGAPIDHPGNAVGNDHLPLEFELAIAVTMLRSGP